MRYGLDDIRQRRLFIEEDGQDGKGGDSDHKRREHQRLDALIAYCETSTCRRRVLLSYFGDAEPTEHMAPCGNCDVCLNPTVPGDGTSLAPLAPAPVPDGGQDLGPRPVADLPSG